MDEKKRDIKVKEEEDEEEEKEPCDEGDLQILEWIREQRVQDNRRAFEGRQPNSVFAATGRYSTSGIFLSPRVISRVPPARETKAEQQTREHGAFIHFVDWKERKSSDEWEKFLFDPEVAVTHPLRRGMRGRSMTIMELRRNKILPDRKLPPIRWEKDIYSDYPAEMEKFFEKGVSREGDASERTIKEWTQIFFGANMDLWLCEAEPSNRQPPWLDEKVTLASFVKLYESVFLQNFGGYFIAPSPSIRQIFFPVAEDHFLIVPPRVEERRFVIRTDQKEFSENWAYHFGVEVPDRREMTVSDYLERIKDSPWPRRWKKMAVQPSSSEYMMFEMVPDFYQNQCINSASYISGDEWQSSQQDVFFFYTAASSDWKAVVHRGGDCVSVAELRQAVFPRDEQLEKRIVGWKGDEKEGEPIPTIRFARLPSPPVWINDEALVVLKESLDDVSEGTAFLCLPLGYTLLGTVEGGIHGIASSMHGSEQMIYGLLPFRRDWTQQAWWPALFKWLVEHSKHLFHYDGVRSFFRNVFLPFEICDFNPWLEKAIAPAATIHNPPFRILARMISMLFGPFAKPWKIPPTFDQIEAAVNTFVSIFTLGRIQFEEREALRIMDTYLHAIVQSGDVARYWTDFTVKDALQRIERPDYQDKPRESRKGGKCTHHCTLKDLVLKALPAKRHGYE